MADDTEYQRRKSAFNADRTNMELYCGPRDLFNEQRIEITLSSNDAVNLSILGRP